VHSVVLRETLGVEPHHAVQELADKIAKRTATTIPSAPLLAVVEPATSMDSRSSTARVDAEPDVSDLYLRARFEWHRRTEECLKVSATLFEQVVEREPDHARAWVGLADAYAVMAFYDYLPPRVAFPRAECAARQAIRLDPGDAAAHATLAYVDTFYHWNWQSAEHGFQRAITLEPTYSMAHLWYGSLLTALGRFDEAERHARRAAELEPLSLIAHASIGWVSLMAKRSDRAIRQLQSALQLDAGFALANYWMAVALEQSGRTADAVRVLRDVLEQSNRCAVVMASLARAHAIAGEIDAARELLNELLEREARGRYISSYGIGKIHHALGDPGAALKRLERSYTDRSHAMALINVDPDLESIRDDPRFADFVVRVNGSAKAGGAPSAVRRSGENAFQYP
jgi:tetratricopeptide (TPR) repeat protein